MNFALFVLLNGILIIRPEEIYPDIAGARLYLIVITLCVLTTLPNLLLELSPQMIRERPITFCVMGLLFSMALSDIARGSLEFTAEAFPEFIKVILYYLLLLAVINTPARMLCFFKCIIVFVLVLTIIGILQFHDYIDIEAIRPVEQRVYDPDTGAPIDRFNRLCSSGIYNDPNDLCLILVTGSLSCLCRARFATSLLGRISHLCPLGLFGYAIMLTQSRGGLLGCLAAVLALIYAVYGRKRFLPVALLVLPPLLVLFAGRQTDINTSGNDTSGERMRLWAEGISLMLQNPLRAVTGIGVNQYAEEMGLVAHNSFVHAYVEMGLLGGTFFLGAFYLAALSSWWARAKGDLDEKPILLGLQPFIFAMVVGYAAGAYSVSRNFVVPTYMILGLAAAFMNLCYERTPEWFYVDARLMKKIFLAGIGGFVFLKLFTQALVRY